MSFLTKCLDGYKITEEDKKSAQNKQTTNVIIGIVIAIIAIWWIFS